MTRRRALLGRLAGLGWFARHGEVAMTQAMAMLLEEPALRSSTLALLGERSGVDLTDVTTFHAEAVLDDRSRPDLEGRDSSGLPLVMIEAKFGAGLTAGQLDAYYQDQQRRLQGCRRGIVAVLVPPHRVHEARAVCADLPAAEGTSDPLAVVTVIDWDTLLDRWDSVAADLLQLRELCLTLGGLHMRPLGDASSGPRWRDRANDLHSLVDQLTRRLQSGERTLPIQHEDGYDPIRYVPGGYPVPGSYCSIGLADRFADTGAAPLWLRYHRDTKHFRAILDTLLASPMRHMARTDEGHLWLPLHVKADLAGERVVDDLEAQVREIHALLGTPSTVHRATGR